MSEAWLTWSPEGWWDCFDITSAAGLVDSRHELPDNHPPRAIVEGVHAFTISQTSLRASSDNKVALSDRTRLQPWRPVLGSTAAHHLRPRPFRRFVVRVGLGYD